MNKQKKDKIFEEEFEIDKDIDISVKMEIAR